MPDLARIFNNRYGFALGSLSFGLVSYVLYKAFTEYIWKWGLTDIPNLNGTWEGHIYTSYDGAEASETAEIEHEGLTPMDATLTIDQTWDEILVFLNGPDSTSESVGATILVEGHWPTLTYNYDNSGDSHHDDKSPHCGTTMLNYNPDKNTLSGTYYTDPNRGNAGRIEVKRVED